ncbi:TPA: bacterial Ig-like domain-containing protein, partial [Enterococcus faecalis]|nr:bacterial Ig-like domain-containing protein [Enterococcus faecalis]
MRKKFILLLFVLIFSIKQEEVVFSEIETVSTQAKIIESYDNTLRQGLGDMEIITPYYIDEGEVFDHRKVVLDATDVNGFKIPLFEIRYKWEDKALDTSKKGNSAVALLYWEKDPFTTYRATIKVAYDLILQTQNSTIYQGEIWNPMTNFVRANDEDSNPVYWNDDRIKTNNASIDTNVPGVYYHRYTLKGQNKEVSSTF